MDDLVIEGKTYLSSKRAAEVTGYAKDYVGQLCREGRVEARLVGRSWYVLDESIREHRFGKEEEQAVDPEPMTVEREEAPSVVEDTDSWNSPKYVTEEVAPLPPLRPKMVISRPLNLLASELASDIASVEAVKTEGGKSRFPEEDLIVDEQEDQQSEEQEVEVAIHKVAEVQKTVVEAPKPPMPHPVTRQKRRIKALRAQRRGNGLVYTATIVGVAIVALAVILIGTGYIDETPFEGKNESIIDYLGGKSFYYR